MGTGVVLLLSATILSLLTGAAVIRAARALELFDLPGVRKLHQGRIPRLGGISIALSLGCLVVPLLAWPQAVEALHLDPRLSQSLAAAEGPIIALLSGGCFLFLVGLVDDLCSLRARTKLSAQLIASIVLCASGARLQHVSLGPDCAVDIGSIAWPLTILWIVGSTNALNFIDGLDGLAGGIAAIACLVVAAIAWHAGQIFAMTLMLTLLGGILGFLCFNLHPARIFMGDGGSLMLGFLIAGSAVIVANAHEEATVAAILPVGLALGIPILDTFCSILRRVLSRRSLFAPDRGHIHHRLVELGFSQPNVVVILHGATLAASGLGLFMLVSHQPAVLFVFCGVVLLLAMLFRTAGAFRLRESMAALNANLAIARRFREDLRQYEEAQLYMRGARCFDEWWQALTEVARALQFTWIALNFTSRDGTSQTLVWRHPQSTMLTEEQSLRVCVPVRDRRTGPSLRLDVVTVTEDSLEITGRRLMLLSRVIELHGLVTLPDTWPTGDRSPVARKWPAETLAVTT